MLRKTALFWGVVIILVGVLSLVDAFVDINLGAAILPLLLIALGLWILWGILTKPQIGKTEEVAIPLEGAAQARIRIRHGAGQLRLGPGAGPEELLNGSFGGGLTHQAKREGETLDVEMSVPRLDSRVVFPGLWWGPGSMLNWKVNLNPEVALSLDLETGACDTRLDLADLRVTNLRVQTGASSTDITLPARAGHTKATIRSGAASVQVRIPEGVAARIRARGGMAGISVSKSRFPRRGSVYQSDDYDAAENRVDLDIETGVGAVDVR